MSSSSRPNISILNLWAVITSGFMRTVVGIDTV
jgi:hypothetical protein